MARQDKGRQHNTGVGRRYRGRACQVRLPRRPARQFRAGKLRDQLPVRNGQGPRRRHPAVLLRGGAQSGTEGEGPEVRAFSASDYERGRQGAQQEMAAQQPSPLAVPQSEREWMPVRNARHRGDIPPELPQRLDQGRGGRAHPRLRRGHGPLRIARGVPGVRPGASPGGRAKLQDAGEVEGGLDSRRHRPCGGNRVFRSASAARHARIQRSLLVVERGAPRHVEVRAADDGRGPGRMALPRRQGEPRLVPGP